MNNIRGLRGADGEANERAEVRAYHVRGDGLGVEDRDW